MKNKLEKANVFSIPNTNINITNPITLIIFFRILKKKEDTKRFKEKFCFPSKKTYQWKFNMVSWIKCW